MNYLTIIIALFYTGFGLSFPSEKYDQVSDEDKALQARGLFEAHIVGNRNFPQTNEYILVNLVNSAGLAKPKFFDKKVPISVVKPNSIAFKITNTSELGRSQIWNKFLSSVEVFK